MDDGPKTKSTLGGHAPKYGVLKGRPFWQSMADASQYHRIIGVLGQATNREFSINVNSEPSDPLQCLLVRGYDHAILTFLGNLNQDFTQIKSIPRSGALDYVRDHFFDTKKMGATNNAEIRDLFDAMIKQPIPERPLLYAFGTTYGPASRVSGISNIHMNQGSPGVFKSTNDIWQDGALFIQYPHNGSWDALFLKFASQTFDTDQTGNPKT